MGMIWLTSREEGGYTALVLSGKFLDLRTLPDRLRSVLRSPDFSDRVVRRLFPQAYTDDAEAELQYQRLMRDDLIQRKLDCVESFAASIRSSETITLDSGITLLKVDLTDEDLAIWLGCLHDLRLVIGTALDIADDNWMESVTMDHPDFNEFMLLEHLAHVEQTLVEALCEADGFETE